MAAKRRNRAIARVIAQQQKKDPSHEWKGPQLINDHGVKIPFEDKKRLDQLTRIVEEKRQETIKMVNPLPRKVEGLEVGGTVGEMRSMGREVDFILAKKDKSWQDFKDKEHFDRYLQRMERIADPNYLRDRIRLYKRNFTSSLLETYGDQAQDIAMKIRMMKPEDYMKLVESDESLEIGYYGDSDDYIPGMLNKIRRTLGMKEKEEWDDEFM